MSTGKIAKTNGHGGKRNGAGQPPFQATDQERHWVQIMRAGGMTTQRIANALRPGGVPRSTMEKHFKDELATGFDHIHAKIMSVIYGKALNGEWPACKFLATHRMGFSETIVVDGNVHIAAAQDLRDDLERRFARIAAAQEPQKLLAP